MNLSESGPYSHLVGLPMAPTISVFLLTPAPYVSPYTCYDSDGDGEPDPMVVAGEAAVTGIDVALGGPWLPLGGPSVEGGQVNALAVHPAIAGTVYAAVAPLDAYESAQLLSTRRPTARPPGRRPTSPGTNSTPWPWQALTSMPGPLTRMVKVHRSTPATTVA